MRSWMWLGLGLGIVVFVMAAAGAPTNAVVHLCRVPEQGLQPQAVVDQQGTLHLVYLKGDPMGCDVFYVRRGAGQESFTVPVRVNSEPGTAVALGTVRGAQLALGAHGRVHVAWNGANRGPHAAGAEPGMFYTRLDEAGAGFEAQRNLMRTSRGLDGGGSVAADGEGNVYVVWHGRGANEPEGEAHRTVFVAHSGDEGRHFAPEEKANAAEVGACACCGLKAVAGTKGLLAVLYRSANGQGTRDALLLVSRDGGNSFATRILGTWRIPNCPMSTQALGLGPGDNLTAMWETQGQVYRTMVDPTQVNRAYPSLSPAGNAGKRKYPVYAFGSGKPGKLLTAWVEGAGWGTAGTLHWECVELGTGIKTAGERTGVPVWSYAAAVAEADGSLTLIY